MHNNDVQYNDDAYPGSDDNWLKSIKYWFNGDWCIQAAEVHYGVGYRWRSVIKRFNYENKSCKHFTPSTHTINLQQNTTYTTSTFI